MLTRFVALLTALAVGLSGVAPGAMAQPAAAPLAVPKDDTLHAQQGAQPLDAPQTPPPPSAAEFKAAAGKLSARFDPIHYDLWFRAAQLGRVESVFEWVRDNVRFDAYAGAFRGAKGAYMARAANAADRSLLLAELLTAKGFPTRFVTGRLPAEQAAALFERVFQPTGADAGDAPPAAFTADSAGKKAFLDRLAARARRDYAAVRAALGDTLPAASPTREEVLAEIADHVWVQAEVDGRWVDFDTAFADAEVGRAYCEGGAPTQKLPDALHQRVTVRVLVEHLDGGKIVTAKALEVTKPAVDLVSAQVYLIHVPESAGRGRGAAGFGGALGGAFGGGGAADADPAMWVPVLSVATETTKGTPVRFDDGRAKPAAPRRGGGLGGLAGDTGDDPDASAGGSPRFVAEFLEFELAFPGGRREVTRRVLSDCAGPAWRAAGAPDAKALRPLLRDDKGPVAPQVVHDIRFSAGSHDMAAYAADVKVLASAIVERPDGAGAGGGRPAPAPERSPPPGEGLEMTRQLWLLALQNLPVVAFGDHVVLPALNDDPAVRFYLDSPRILLFSLGAAGTADGKQASPMLEAEIDLRRDKVRGVARDAGAAPAVAKRKIWHGIVGGALEHEIAAEQAAAIVADVGDAADASPAAVFSTSALLDAGGVVVIRPGDAAKQAVADLKLDPDTSLRLAEALAGGEAVVVPGGAAPGTPGAAGRGFWAIALSGGDTRAVWGDGGHMSRMRSPLRHPGPQTYNPRAWVIDEKTLNSHREGGNEYTMIVYDTAIRTITYLELLYIIGAAIPWLTLAYRLWW